MEVNKKLKISGVVQGVGFRPFIYQLALRHNLNGYIVNNTSGVDVEVEGNEDSILLFMDALKNELPPLARIDSLVSTLGEYRGYNSFNILQSETLDSKSALVSPDIAICNNCLKEMNDPNNRRYNYPFINCTDCGPRYSIMKTLPYDRPHTSMQRFDMCKTCYNEYIDALDRRFHAQPISCHECGPKLILRSTDGKELANDKDALTLTADAIKQGHVVAIKGLGGFHLICDATNSKAVEKLRQRKQRPVKPFAVMFPDINMLKISVNITEVERELIISKEKPIVIVPKKSDNQISDLVAPWIDRLGVFLPYTPLHHLLLKELSTPVVATSANLSDEPIIRESSELVQKLGAVVDLVLDHDRDIVNANDDSVVQVAGTEKITLRMSRGYAPQSIKLPFRSKKKILAVGANQKNTITLIFDDALILSPHIGDLNSLEAFEYFERTLETFKGFYDFEPEVIVYDKHPEYMSTKWAKQFIEDHSKLIGVQLQHHYAHLLSGMAEFQLKCTVLGFAFDGTGYGDDGTIWGGEVMLADNRHYERIGTLSPFRLLGADKAIKEPRRSALSLLFETYTLEEIHALEVATVSQFSKEQIDMLYKAWEKGINAPLCSSMGRLFDAVASIADIVHVSSFEGESGLMMEQYVDETITRSFPFDIIDRKIDLQPMICEMIVIEDKKELVSVFFNTISDMIFHIASQHPELPLLFSGGVFQNRVLVEKISNRCRDLNRTCYFQNNTPINDGGISLGQAWYALHQYVDI